MAAALAPAEAGFIVPVEHHTVVGGTLEGQICCLIELIEESASASSEEERAAFDAAIRNAISGSKNKVDAIAGVLSELETREKACAAEIARLQARKQAAAGNAKRLRGYVVAVCAAAGLKKLEGLTSGFTIRNNAAQLDIFNEEDLPGEYIDVEIEERHTPNTQRIKTALANGADVPGARLVQTQSAVRR